MIIMGMYDDIVEGVSESITIMGLPFYAENIRPNEPYNRREREFTPILGGTERVTQGKYIHREWTFNTTIFFPTGRPDAYDKQFKEMLSKPVEVISRYMGGKVNALIKVSPEFPESSPNHMDLEVTVTEVPGKKSLIPGESFTVPKTKKISTKTKVTTTKKTSNSNKTSSKNSKSKRNTVKKKNKIKGK